MCIRDSINSNAFLRKAYANNAKSELTGSPEFSFDWPGNSPDPFVQSAHVSVQSVNSNPPFPSQKETHVARDRADHRNAWKFCKVRIFHQRHRSRSDRAMPALLPVSSE